MDIDAVKVLHPTARTAAASIKFRLSLKQRVATVFDQNQPPPIWRSTFIVDGHLYIGQSPQQHYRINEFIRKIVVLPSDLWLYQ